MVNKAYLLERFKYHPRKITKTDISLLALLDRQVHTMYCHVSTAPHYTVQLLDKELESGEKLLIILGIAHILQLVRVGVKFCEWW